MKARKSSSTLLRYNSVVTLFDKFEVVALSQPLARFSCFKQNISVKVFAYVVIANKYRVRVDE